MDEKNRGHHDLGGLSGGPVDRTEHAAAFWEKQIDAMLRLLIHKDRSMIRVDELRRGVESLDPEAYRSLGYYERWIASIAHILVEKGVLTRDEIEARVEDIRRREPT